ncbi:MAG TPA: NAD(P)-dependent oxidoreductase [Acidimicrobiales bacterium]|nr:NAD(P)-dependent oxidoreductase [Acidimicrobiales bacterium]
MGAAVLVTGTSGLVGGAVARMLRGRGQTVLGVDVRPGPGTDVVGDLRRLDLASVTERAAPAAVVHLAALHAPHVGRQPDADFWSINVDATAALLAAAAAAGATRFVFASTTSVYGAAMRPGPDATAAAWVDETLTPEPEDVYDATKLAAEALVAAAHPTGGTGHASSGGMVTLTLRIGRCFPESPPVLAAHRLHRGVDLRDVVQAHRLALDAARAAGDGPLVANVAGPLVFRRDDRPALLTDAAAVIDRRVPGLRQAFVRRGWSLPATIDRVYDSSRARRALGYAPVHDAWATLAP